MKADYRFEIAGDEYEIVGDKFPALVTKLRESMMSPSESNEEYMKRFAEIIELLHGIQVPTGSEREFCRFLMLYGYIVRLD